MNTTFKGELVVDAQPNPNAKRTDWAVFLFAINETIREPRNGDMPYYCGTHQEALDFIIDNAKDHGTRKFQYVLRYFPTIHY